MVYFYAVYGSTAPSMNDTLRQADGTPVDLTDTTVTLRLQHESTDEVREYAMEVVEGEAGTIRRQWQAGDLEITLGRWFGQYRVLRGESIEIWPLPTALNLRDAWRRFGLSFEVIRAIPPE
jgi:hypothetical protein